MPLSLQFSDMDNAAVNRADLYACGFVMPAKAVNTGGFINDIDIFSGCNGTYRTLRFTCSAIRA